MHPINLFAKSIMAHNERPELPCIPKQGVCAITGIAGDCIPRKELLGKSFTNLDLLARPDSPMVSADAFYALKFKWERMSSWFCDVETFEKLDRKGVRQKALQRIMPEMWIAYATTSYHKHGVLNTKVNMGRKRLWLFETRLIDMSDMGKVFEWWEILNRALRSGIGRSVLESLICPPFLISKIGLRAWLEFENWGRQRYLSPLYAFLCYLLPSQEELKNESRTEY